MTDEARKALADEIERDIKTSGVFHLYQVKGAAIVAALRFEPGPLAREEVAGTREIQSSDGGVEKHGTLGADTQRELRVNKQLKD